MPEAWGINVPKLINLNTKQEMDYGSSVHLEIEVINPDYNARYMMVRDVETSVKMLVRKNHLSLMKHQGQTSIRMRKQQKKHLRYLKRFDPS